MLITIKCPASCSKFARSCKHLISISVRPRVALPVRFAMRFTV